MEGRLRSKWVRKWWMGYGVELLEGLDALLLVFVGLLEGLLVLGVAFDERRDFGFGGFDFCQQSLESAVQE